MTASLQLIVARSGFQLSGSPLFADRASRNARYSSSSDPRISNLLASTDDPLANVESIAGTAPSRARSLSLSDLVFRSRFLFLFYLCSVSTCGSRIPRTAAVVHERADAEINRYLHNTMRAKSASPRREDSPHLASPRLSPFFRRE
jgi:hypothetical protein